MTTPQNNPDRQTLEVVRIALDKCYADRPADGHWIIQEHNLIDIAVVIERYALKQRIDELKRAKLQGYVHGSLKHKVERRLGVLEQQLTDLEKHCD